jgi:tRNA dimethylallyltransferase
MNIIIISGPTASGKTKKAVELCKTLNGEIISCDSRQIYKYIDIGTNKEGNVICDGIRIIDGILQYLVDILNPDQIYNVTKFVHDADFKIFDILKRKKVPVIVGGNGLYIKALLYGIDCTVARNEYLRNKLKHYSLEKLYSMLYKLDRYSAEKNKNNPQRLIRAIEINIISGKTVNENFKIKFENSRYNFKHYSIYIENDILYKKINHRCKKMIENGMIEETKKILKMGFNKNCQAFNTIGYKYVIQYINKQISINELILKFSKDTRHYAKRQKTWFKNQKDIKFI